MFYEMKTQDENGAKYTPTKSRPSSEAMKELRADAKQTRSITHQHAPGNGWHYVPGKVDYFFNGQYWFCQRSTSEGAILAHVLDLCNLYGLNFDALQREAYPNEAPQAVNAADLLACTRPATKDDTCAVLESLEDVNYHGLAGLLSQKTGVNF